MVSFDQAMQLRLFGPRLDPRLLSMPIDVTGRWNPGSDRTGSQVESGPDMGSTGVVRKMAKDWRQMPQTCPHRSVNSKPSRSVEAGNGVVIAKSIMEPAFLDEILTFAQRVKHVEEWGAAGPHGGEWDHQDSKSKKTKKQTSIRSARPRLSTLTSPMAAAGALQQQHLTSTLLNPSWEAPPRYQQSPFLGPLERKLERQMVRSAKKSYPGFDHLSRVRARPRTATPSCSGPHRSDRHAAAERDVSGFIEGMEESQRRSRPRTAVGFGGEQSAACASADMRANKDANRKEFRPSIGLRGGGLEQRDRKQRLERPHTAPGMGPEAGRRQVSPPRAQSKPLAEDLESSPTWRPGTSNGISEDHDVQCRGSEGEVQRGHMHRDSKDATETIEAPWATQPASGGSWFIPERPFYFKDHHREIPAARRRSTEEVPRGRAKLRPRLNTKETFVGSRIPSSVSIKSHHSEAKSEIVVYLEKMAKHKIFLGCPGCFSSLGGLCVRHIDTHWKGSIRESEAPDATRDGEFLSVRVYTAADPRKRGTEYKIKLKSGDTVRSLKSKIFELDGTPPDFQRFRGTRGKYIDDETATLQDINVQNGGCLFVVLPPPAPPSRAGGAACELCAKAIGGVCTGHLTTEFLKNRGQSPPKQGKSQRNMTRKERLEALKKEAAERGAGQKKERRAAKLRDDSPHVKQISQRDSRNSSEYDSPLTGSRCSSPLHGPQSRQGTLEKIMSDLIESSPLGSEEIHPAQEDLRNRSLSPQDGESGHRLSSSASSERLSRSLSPCAAIAHSRSGLPDESHSKLPVNVKTRLRQGCPLCEGAINGMCHRCLPVLRSKGHHKDLREADMETQYQQAFALGREARERILSRNQPPWFHLCGVPCTKGTKVRVLMENGEWYVGEIDAYSRKNDKVRLKFPQDFLGLVHAPLQQLSIEPVTKEEQPTALSSQSLSSWFASDQSQDILGADKDLNRLSGSSVGLAEADNHEASAVSAYSMLVSDVVGPVDTPRSRCCVTLESGFKGILQEQGQGLSQSISREQFIDRAQGAENGNRLCQHFLVEDAGADSLKSKQSEHPVYNPASQQRERASGAKSIVVRVASIPSEDAGCHGF